MNKEEHDEIMKRVATVFRDVFDDDELEVNDATSAADIEDWDSLMHVTLVVALEKEFGLRLKAAEIGGLDNVGAMIDLIGSKLGKSS